MPNISAEECKRRVNEFLDAHKECYTEREIAYIKNNAALLARDGKANYGSSILRQVYDSLGLIPKEENIYHGFIELIESHFDIDRNIVEVAGGIIPSLATKIALRQKTGTITVYDPRIIVPTQNPKNLILKRQSFHRDIQLPGAQMIIGFMPCEAALPIVESACLNEMDFMVALCEGGLKRGYEWLETDDEWLGYVKYLATKGMRKKNMGTLETTDLKKYNYEYPVIYNKRK